MIILGYAKNHLQLYKGKMRNGKFLQEVFLETPVSDNLIVNGIIQNSEEYVSSIKSLLKKGHITDKEVTVIIDSSSIIYRDIRVPLLSNKEINKFVYHTFDVQLPNSNDYVIDYMLVEENPRGKRIIGMAIPTMVVNSYKEALIKVGLKAKKATTSIYSLIALNTIYKSKNNISLYTNGDVLSCVIFNNGSYDFSNVTRLVNKAEPEREIIQRIDQVVQFEKVQASDYSYDLIYGIGVDVDRLRMYDETLSLNDAVNTRYIDSRINPNALLYTVMYLKNKKKQVNLFKGVSQQSEHSENKLVKRLLMLLLCNVVVIGGIYGYKWFEYSSLLEKENEINKSFNEPVFYGQYSKAMRYLELNQMIEEEVNTYQLANDFIKENTSFTYNTFAHVFNIADNIVINGYAYANDILVLSAAGINQEAPYIFIQALEKSDMFESVEYTGYSYNDTDKTYKFTVSIRLKKDGN